MTTIYCSNKFADFLGKEKLSTADELVVNYLGDWNGHIFYHQRKKYLILINSKVYYSLIFPPVKKADLQGFGNFFLQRLLKQLAYDRIIGEDKSLNIVPNILPIQLHKTNNDKKALGTMNDFIFRFKFEFDYFGWNDQNFYEINHKLNDTLVGASRTKQGDYGRPLEDMSALINSIANI